MELKKTFIFAILLSIVGLICWEMYWRSQGLYPNLDDNKELWAQQRDRVGSLINEDVILLGSSRVLFDIQIDEWENVTGRPPLQLASAGSSPLPMFRDIVENTEFSGTVIVGVTPGLFFSTTFPLAQPMRWPQTRVDYYRDRTYAQKLNYFFSAPLQNNLVLMSANELEWNDDIDLKALVKRIKIGNRIGEGMPPFYNFFDASNDRNISMTLRTSSDTTFANSITKVWQFYGEGGHPPDKESTMAYFLEDVEKFKARGGNLVLLRCPSTGGARAGENAGLPRTEFWDQLVTESKVKGYHFEDHESLKNFDCPEWSHLSAADARLFTTELATIMKNDDALTISKNQ
jgi:hypothetical protein